MSGFRVACRRLPVTILVIAMALGLRTAFATDGYFQHGFGARQKALAGAGVADSTDATAAALNPAGLVHVGDQIDVSASFFSPRRGFVGTGAPGLTPLGDVESSGNFFFIPNLAWSYRPKEPLPFFDVLAFSVYANGGLNVHFDSLSRVDGGCGLVGGGTGVFCRGPVNDHLQQAFASIAVAKQFGDFAVGIAPVLAYQLIKFGGLQLFADVPGLSIDPTTVTDRHIDRSLGFGVRGGVEWSVVPGVRLGVAGNSRVWTESLEKYRGLLAEGDFDIPASIQAGVAVDVMPTLTVMADFKYIWYSTIRSLGNPSTNILACPAIGGTDPSSCLGAANGPGFGWKDIAVIKFGAEWRASPQLALRGGYAWNEQPMSGRDAMVNILAPGLVQHHFTAGAKYQLNRNWSLEIAGFFVPRSTVKGAELPVIGNPAHQIELYGKGTELTAGLSYRFDADPRVRPDAPPAVTK
jgi:long-chain fatty acid transport protein